MQNVTESFVQHADLENEGIVIITFRCANIICSKQD